MRCSATFAGTLVLRDAVERRFGGTKYADVPAPGLYIVRGENLAVLGEVVRARLRSGRRLPCAASR